VINDRRSSCFECHVAVSFELLEDFSLLQLQSPKLCVIVKMRSYSLMMVLQIFVGVISVHVIIFRALFS